VEWPTSVDANGNTVPDFLPPDGVEHHYAPLGFVSLQNKTLTQGICRCHFEPLSSCFELGSVAVGAQLLRPVNFGARLTDEESVSAESFAGVYCDPSKPQPGYSRSVQKHNFEHAKPKGNIVRSASSSNLS
jgi:hypothetical protein